MTVKALFLISPAYSVPTMSTSIRARWSRIAVSVRVPSVAGSALNDGNADDREVRLEGRELLGRGPAEEVAREDARPCGLGVDTQAAPVIRVGADLAVLGVQVTLGGVCDEPSPEPIVVLLGDWLVDHGPTRSSTRSTARGR